MDKHVTLSGKYLTVLVGPQDAAIRWHADEPAPRASLTVTTALLSAEQLADVSKMMDEVRREMTALVIEGHPARPHDAGEVVEPVDAARLAGVSRQRLHQLAKEGRIETPLTRGALAEWVRRAGRKERE